MKIWIASIAFVLFGTLAQAQETPLTPVGTPEEANPNAPKIEFVETVIDYGTINKGANGQRQFKYKNTGKEPLIISTCKGSCGCTVPKCNKEPILPGQEGAIDVKYDTQRLGKFSKTVTVRSNASNGVVMLRIKGEVKQGVTDPSLLPPEHRPGNKAKDAGTIK